MDITQREWVSQQGPSSDQPPSVPVVVISDGEEEEEEEEEDEASVVVGTQCSTTSQPRRQQLPRSLGSILGYRSLTRDKQQRAERAMTQRMLILSRETLDDYCEEFEVIGTVGSAYNVTIGQRMSCSCIDFTSRSSPCKHILMLLLKVYRLDFTSPLYRSLSSTSEQRKDAIMKSTHDPSAFVSDAVRQRINQVLYQSSTASRPIAQQHPLDHSDCAICFDPFIESERTNVEFCWVCGNNVHGQCMARWISTRTGVNETNATCIYCNQTWHILPTTPGEHRRKDASKLDSRHVDDHGFVNVAVEAGLPSQRPDFRPFYRGRIRRRGRRYNYYDDECECDCCSYENYEDDECDCYCHEHRDYD
ncbi:hypothetical protein K501DRAFT_300395 [Backusella circina FSU 941]|nr:hypothetical protein K501DRAFT_300395 [Backusella circina FSU 941]